MSESYLYNFFGLSPSPDVLFMISPLIASDAGILKNIFQVIDNFIDSPEINKKDLLKYIGIGFIYSMDHFKNSSHLNRKKYFYLRNDKIIESIMFKFELFDKTDNFDFLIGLESLRILNLIVFDFEDCDVIKTVCLNESKENIQLILEFLKTIIYESDKQNNFLYTDFINRFEITAFKDNAHNISCLCFDCFKNK